MKLKRGVEEHLRQLSKHAQLLIPVFKLIRNNSNVNIRKPDGGYFPSTTDQRDRFRHLGTHLSLVEILFDVLKVLPPYLTNSSQPHNVPLSLL
jgi:hypothetical protein